MDGFCQTKDISGLGLPLDWDDADVNDLYRYIVVTARLLARGRFTEAVGGIVRDVGSGMIRVDCFVVGDQILFNEVAMPQGASWGGVNIRSSAGLFKLLESSYVEVEVSVTGESGEDTFTGFVPNAKDVDAMREVRRHLVCIDDDERIWGKIKADAGEPASLCAGAQG